MSLRGNTGVFEIEYVLITILFFYVILFYNLKNQKIVIGKLLLPLIIFLFYSGISILWTPVKAHGFKALLGMLEGYLVYYLLTNGFFKIEKTDLKKISVIATFIMITLSCEILYVYFDHGFLNVFFDKSLVNISWGYSNFIAVIYVILIPISLYKYLDKTKYYPHYFFLDIINIFGLILTQSRGAYVGTFVSLLLFFIFFLRKDFFIKYLTLIIVPFILFITIFNQYFLRIFAVFKERYFTEKMLDGSGRLPLYKLAFDTFLDKMIFGNGLKSSKYMIKQYLGGWVAHYHNFILQIASTLGIVGLILFSFIVIRWIKVLYKPKDKFIVCGALSIIGALVHQLFDVSFDLFYFGVFFYGVIAIVEIYRNNLLDDEVKFTYLGKIVNDNYE